MSNIVPRSERRTTGESVGVMHAIRGSLAGDVTPFARRTNASRARVWPEVTPESGRRAFTMSSVFHRLCD
jgi:hypothetical protein